MKYKEYKTYKVSYNISEKDIEYRKVNINKHLLKGYKIKVIMTIKGRASHLYKDALEKLKAMFSEYKLINAWGKGNSYYLFITK